MKQNKQAAILFAILVPLTAISATNYPPWWLTWNVINTNATPNDYAPVMAGQLKWMAAKAYDELQTSLPGGAGTGVAALVSGFSTSNNYVPVNLGQLKYVADPFYERLIAAEFTNAFPWTTNTTEDDADFSPANLGQLKNVFSFDIAYDTDGDSMPDWWEMQHGLNPANSNDVASDADGDHFLNIYEYVHNSDPSSSTSTPSSGGFVYVSLAGSHTYPYTNWAMAATNIQTALNVATSDYDIVLVADGMYVGPQNRNLQFPGNPIMLTSTNGASNCIVDGDATDCVFYFNNGQGLETVLSDVTIQNGYPTNGAAGITCIASEPTIQYCLVEANDGVGIGCYDGSDASIEGCVVSGNGDDGIDCSASSPAIRNCIIVGNTYYGIWAYYAAAPLVDDCTINSNSCGVVCNEASPAIRSCAIAGNSLYGIYAYYAAPTGQHCTIESNVVGVYCVASAPVLDRCRIQQNSLDGMYLYSANPVVRDSIVSDNGRAGMLCYTSSPCFYNCTIANNAWVGLCGASNSSAEVQNCIIWGNDLAQIYGFEYAYITYCTVQEEWTGTGNTTNDPLVIPLSYRLRADSPCIDAGTDASASTNDIDDEGRWDDPSHSNLVSIVDRGADEFVDQDNDDMADAWELQFFGATTISGGADSDNDGLDNASEYADGSCPTNADTDGDGINDGDEVGVGFNPLTGNSYVLYTDFETSGGYSVGALNGQEEWVAPALPDVQVVVGAARRGDQAVRLQGLNVAAENTCVSTGQTVTLKSYVYLGPQSSPPTNLPASASCLVSFDSTNGIVAFDGEGEGTGTWVVATNTLLTGQWVQLGIEQNYSNSTWKLFVNGVEKLDGLGFKNDTVTNLSGFGLRSGIGGSVSCDDIVATED